MESNEQRILSVVRLIPMSMVASYGQVADLAGLPKRARLVSKVLKGTKEKEIPWHRIVSSQGKISIPKSLPSHALQRQLLLDEGVDIKGNSVDMAKHRWQPSIDTLLFQLSY